MQLFLDSLAHRYVNSLRLIKQMTSEEQLFFFLRYKRLV